ncbi:MAG: hypothetical protein GY749_39465 [Desulfobacteraceae bacterium]|nr:hypothetical protein [Desulfobacteraceae bacterium]
MEAIRTKKKIESDMLHLPILKQIIGKNVEIIMLIELLQPWVKALGRRNIKICQP